MTTFGTPHRHIAQCGSTNDLAREWARDPNAPAPSGALVTADFQTRGRGQRGRQWQAGWGQSSLMSLVYHLPPKSDAGQLGLVVALAVADAVASLTGLAPRLKWPNDILLEGRKVAGILVEIAPAAPNARGGGEGSGVGKAILGIGVNINQERFDDSEGFAYPPTSLHLATGRTLEVGRVAAAVSSALSQREQIWRQDGFAPILEECRKRLAAGVTVRRGEQEAELVGLASSGAAQVRSADGTFADWSTVD